MKRIVVILCGVVIVIASFKAYAPSTSSRGEMVVDRSIEKRETNKADNAVNSYETQSFRQKAMEEDPTSSDDSSTKGAAESAASGELTEAGIQRSPNELIQPVTESEFAKYLLLALYPESRLLMTGHSVYEVSADEETQRIIQTLMDKEASSNITLLDNEQMHHLILLALGLEEDSMIAKTLDELGIIPNLDHPITVGEAKEVVQRIQAIVPSIPKMKQEVQAVNPDLNLSEKAKDAGSWMKGNLNGLFEKLQQE